MRFGNTQLKPKINVMKLELTYKLLSAQAKKLMAQGKVTAYLKALVALNTLSIQKKVLQSLPQPRA